MEKEFIILEEYCIYSNIDISFIEELEEVGLIQILKKEEKKYISSDSISELESYSRMFYDLNINVAGIDAINNLLNKLQSMQIEMENLQKRLRIYEI